MIRRAFMSRLAAWFGVGAAAKAAGPTIVAGEALTSAGKCRLTYEGGRQLLYSACNPGKASSGWMSAASERFLHDDALVVAVEFVTTWKNGSPRRNLRVVNLDMSLGSVKYTVREFYLTEYVFQGTQYAYWYGGEVLARFCSEVDAAEYIAQRPLALEEIATVLARTLAIGQRQLPPNGW